MKNSSAESRVKLFRSAHQIDLIGRRVFPSFWEKTKIPLVLLMDFFGFLRFGPQAPRKLELLYIEPQTVTMRYAKNNDGSWKLLGIEDAVGGTLKNAKKRTAAGETWESCGELEETISHLRKLGKSTNPQAEDFQEWWRTRYGALDALIEELKVTGRLRPQKEFRPQSHFREKEGIGICINAEGNLILANGHHRFGIVLGLGITPIPVYLHSVHPGFMKRKDWKERLQQLRAEPNK